MGKFCRTFSEICRDDVPEAGGKGANLGDMTCAGLPVPPGFVILSSAYRRIFERGGLREQVKHILNSIDRSNAHALQEAETTIRALFERVVIDEELKKEILDHYRQLGSEVAVAVRSSATAEDMGCASFAGQQSTYLNVRGEQALLDNVIKCWSSLFTSQAIYYRFCNALTMTWFQWQSWCKRWSTPKKLG
jgi:pyruvate,water dikinase